MDIREFVSYLHVAKGPDGNGEYLCRCPAHDDRQASLCVGTGEGGRILVKCQAGCDTRDVVKAMGLKMSDLYADGKPAGKPSRPAAAKPAPGPGPEPPPAKGGAKQKPLGKLVKAYPYTDEQGQVLFEVCRFEAEENGHRVKTFRQRHKDPGNPAAKQGGYVWNINGVLDKAQKRRAAFESECNELRRQVQGIKEAPATGISKEAQARIDSLTKQKEALAAQLADAEQMAEYQARQREQAQAELLDLRTQTARGELPIQEDLTAEAVGMAARTFMGAVGYVPHSDKLVTMRDADRQEIATYAAMLQRWTEDVLRVINNTRDAVIIEGV